ncbi:MAG: GPR endopeptidase [Ruminiclostridium sp.]|nr:GPR endopeptidase [Ruminiclostridium sp.]
MVRTDLVFECGIMNDIAEENSVHNSEMYGTYYTDIKADNAVSAKYGIKNGRYLTVFTDKGDVKRCLAALLGELIPDGNVLVAGLGNENICSDSLGVKSLSYIPATAHLAEHSEFSELGLRRVCVTEAGVTGKTGIESSERIRCLAELAGAAAVIAIDSLACGDTERLCRTVQITDTGISPGSGVGNDRKALNEDTVGVPVIAIGVPTVIDLSSITGSEDKHGLMVTPRSIDIYTDRLARIIGGAVSSALIPALTEEELCSLIIK